MTGVVKIGTHEIEMTANAATAYRYRNLFQQDLYVQLQESIQGGKHSKASLTDVIPRLGYVMALQSKGAEACQRANFESFMEWLSQFEASEPLEAGSDIMDLYNAQRATTSTEKKEAGQLSEK